jgi:hypothetical protein
MRLPQNFSALVAVKPLVTTVEVGKPDKQAFIRTHPDPEYRLETVVLEMKADRASYLVHPSLWDELLARDEAVPKVLFTTINRQGVLSLCRSVCLGATVAWTRGTSRPSRPPSSR